MTKFLVAFEWTYFLILSYSWPRLSGAHGGQVFSKLRPIHCSSITVNKLLVLFLKIYRRKLYFKDGTYIFLFLHPKRVFFSAANLGCYFVAVEDAGVRYYLAVGLLEKEVHFLFSWFLQQTCCPNLYCTGVAEPKPVDPKLFWGENLANSGFTASKSKYFLYLCNLFEPVLLRLDIKITRRKISSLRLWTCKPWRVVLTLRSGSTWQISRNSGIS